MTNLQTLQQWVDDVARHTQADQVVWCDGSQAEYDKLMAAMVDSGDMVTLNQDTHPGCFLHRSDPGDVARVEHCTFICTPEQDDAGPNNNWMSPAGAHAKMDALFDGCMQGRTLYVVPYCMGPIDSPLSRCGVELTDSPYVVVNMRLMTRMGSAALARIEREGSFVRGVHSIGELDPERRFIMHFPEELAIQSYGSGYGGNALLGKKCHALRIASHQARAEGWLAEHMLIVGVESPQGETHYIAAAFPSQCGKTNLAMLIPPEQYEGWKIWTVGDDICWMRPGEDGRLWAINPEAGFFGVAPGTGPDTNPTALAMLNEDAIFTNVGVTADNQPWWEGKDDQVPARNWKNEPYGPDTAPAAQANSRFTVGMHQCPSYSEAAEAARGVPLSAIVFGGRRARLMPLVMEADSWRHGVLLGAGMASETTAAATGAVGVVRRDPMAMKPFCGYNFADYWQHWLDMGEQVTRPPGMFHVNWFRKSEQGEYLWPGFGDNMRVLEWIIRRCKGEVDSVATAVGGLPGPGDIDMQGLDLPAENLAMLTEVDAAAWSDELAEVETYISSYGERAPAGLLDELARVRSGLVSG